MMRNLSRYRVHLILLFLLASLTVLTLQSSVVDAGYDTWCSTCSRSDEEKEPEVRCEGDDSRCNNDCSASAGGQINLFTGEEQYSHLDLYLPGTLPLMIVRSYRSQSFLNNRYGFGWDFSFNQRLYILQDGNGVVSNGASGREVYVARRDGTSFQPPPGYYTTLVPLSNGSYELQTQGGYVRVFDQDGKLVEMRDRLNNRIAFNYASEGRLPVTGRSPFFRTVSTGTITLDYRLDSITDSTGRLIEFGYFDDGKLEKIAYGGREVTYEYDDAGNLSSHTDEAGYITHYKYEDVNDPHNLTAVVDHNGETLIQRQYDTFDQVGAEIWTDFNERVLLSFDEDQDRVTDHYDGTGYRTQYHFDSQGNTSRIIEPIDISGNTLSTSLEYNAQNQPGSIRTYDEVSNAYRTQHLTYDTNGRLTSVSTGDGVHIEVLDDSSHYFQPASVTNAVGGTTQFAYHPDSSNLDRLTTPTGNTYDFEWFPNGLLHTVTTPLQAVTTYEYDSQGNLRLIRDAQENETEMEYDALGQLELLTNARLYPTRFAYTPLGQIDYITDARNGVHDFGYDPRGNLTSYTNPRTFTTDMTYTLLDQLETIADPLGNVTTYQYDPLGNVNRLTDGNGITTLYRYDIRGLLTAVERSGLALNTYAYNGFGEMTQATASDLTLNFDYQNGLPGMPAQVEFIGTSGSPIQATLTYDYLIPGANPQTDLRWRSGLVYGLTVANEGTADVEVRYAYTPSMDIRELTATGSTDLHYWFDYDALDRLHVIRPESGTAGIRSIFTYDSIDQLDILTQSSPDQQTVYANLDHDYDAVGNLVRVTNRITGEVTTYEYDALNQLTRAEYPDGTVFVYTYDPAGNRESAEINGATTTYEYDHADQLTSSTANGGTVYTYDRNGNLRTRTDNRGTVVYSWDADNQLIQVTFSDGSSVRYTYDALGRRSSRTGRDGTITYFVYDRLNLVQELDRNGTVIARYVHGTAIDRPFSMTRGGETYHYIYDHLGSVIGLVDSGGNQVNSYIYDPWGNVSGGSSSVENPFLFTGREWDADAGLHFYRTRYYNPEVGRFISKDRIGLRGGVNLFAYASNNPSTYGDPFGLSTIVIITRDSGFGTHAALYVGNGPNSILYDPAGSFDPLAEDGTPLRGSGDFFHGSEIDLASYIRFQESTGSIVETYSFDTTVEQETEIAERVEDLGGAAPGACALRVSAALNGVGPFKVLGTYVLPGSLANALRPSTPSLMMHVGQTLQRISTWISNFW